MLEIWIPVFIVSLVFLVKAADYFIESAEKIGLALKINPFIIGVTIVALGTSLPELITSLVAVFAGSTEIVIGNVVGSNIANFGLVMAIVAITAKKLDLKFEVLIVEIPFFLGSAFLITIMMMDGEFDIFDGVIACLGMIFFVIYTIKGHEPPVLDENSVKEENAKVPAATIVVFILSGAAIYFAAKYNIASVLKIAASLNIGTEVVAQTAVALGTSLPELMVSIAAARRKNIEMAIGNLIGSNIFNSFAVLGIPALVAYWVIPERVLTVPPHILSFSLPIMLAISLIFFVMMITNKINRWQGYLLILFYIYFIGNIIRTASLG